MKISEFNKIYLDHHPLAHHYINFYNATIIDPKNNRSEIGNLIIHNGKFHAINNANHKIEGNYLNIDCEGLCIAPSLIDLAVYIEELSANSIQELDKLAASSGVTSLLLMPKTRPILDNPENVTLLQLLAKEHAKIDILPCGSLTKQLEGKEISEFGLMQNSGAIALSEGDITVDDCAKLKQLMLYARDFNLPILHYSQENSLSHSKNSQKTERFEVADSNLSNWLGLKACPLEAELIALERDLRLVQSTKVRYHASLITLAESAQIIDLYKNKDLNISAATSILHLCYNENDIGNYNTNYKIFPPLRSESNRQALIQAIAQKKIDAIISLHQSTKDNIQCEAFAQHKNTNNNLALLLPLALQLYHNKYLTLSEIFYCLTLGPAQILNLEHGDFSANHKADFIIFDSEAPIITKNCVPLQGKIISTFKNGNLIYHA